MCGIAGIIDFQKQGNPQDLLKLSAVLSHRGPDDEGFVLIRGKAKALLGPDSSDPNPHFPYAGDVRLEAATESFAIGLVHRRLSILDLSQAGHQPMSDASGEHWIAFNGEVYNYIEIREELLQLGHEFFSESDTEVVLHAMMEWGVKALHKFYGMWAFAYYDGPQSELILCRDRTGVKPLYFFPSNNEFIFSSELKALHAVRPTKMNPTAALDFLVNGEVESRSESLFKDFYELKPSQLLRFDTSTNTHQIEDYYKAHLNEELGSFDPSEYHRYVDELGSLLHKSTRMHLRSDVPIGSCLSGGIDSSVLSGLIKEQFDGDNFHCFTASSSILALDESTWAQEVAVFNDFKWHVVKARSEELKNDLDSLTYFQDLPMISLSSYAQYRVMKLAHDHGLKVLVNGQGADELFAGYPHYLLSHWKQESWSFSKIEKALSQEGVNDISYWGKEFLKEKLYKRLSQFPTMLGQLQAQTKLINPEFLRHYLEHDYMPKTPAQNGVNRQLHHDFYKGPLKNLLRYEDRNSMCWSIESRVPFSDDHHLAEWSFGLPGTYKMRAERSKMLLRDAARDYIPGSVYNRRDKMGFVSPNNLWIRELKDEFYDEFKSVSYLFRGDVEVQEFERLIVPQADAENYRNFRYISLALWMNRFKM